MASDRLCPASIAAGEYVRRAAAEAVARRIAFIQGQVRCPASDLWLTSGQTNDEV